VITLFLLAASGPSHGAEPEKKTYIQRTIGETSLIRAGAGALIQQARNVPHEWHRSGSGLAKRFGSALGEHVIKSTVEFGVATARHEALGYQPSGQHGFGSRLKYALVSTVMTHKTTTGKKTVASGRISGVVTSGFVSRLWQPARLHTVSSGIATSGVLLGVDAGSNVVREFWPEIRHPHRQRAASR
jgi:hypothetical protein